MTMRISLSPMPREALDFPDPPPPIIPNGALRALLAALLALAALAAGIAWSGGSLAFAQQENLLERISNERMIAFEQRLEADLNRELRRFLTPGQYVLSVRVIWDRSVIPPVEGPGLTPDKQKLPGFPIFVRQPGEQVDD
jgi:hypothetical protein